MLRSVVKSILGEHPGQENSFYVFEPQKVVSLVKSWTALFPNITPHYAVKSNNDKNLIMTLANHGVCFDCASRTEIELVLAMGVSADKIVFAHTIKSPTDILYAKSVGVNLVTFDSSFELDKIHDLYPECRCILRVKSDDPNAIVQLGNKFGAHEDEVENLLEHATKLSIQVVGVSFHVGSSSRNPLAYYTAIKTARWVYDVAATFGYKLTILDVGGGFHADIDDDGEISTFVSQHLNDAIAEFFGDTDVSVIAEPGRFFSEHYGTLVCRVVGKRFRDGRYEYFINDSVYGGLSNVIYEKVRPTPVVVNDVGDDDYITSTLWGCTCDGVDQINTDISFPELCIGDWLYFESWGAYSNALHTSFNGFGKADVYYN